MEEMQRRLDLLERIVLEIGTELNVQRETWFSLSDLVRELRDSIAERLTANVQNEKQSTE